MITGIHILLNSEKAEADRAFFRDVLGFHSVDAGHGWLIFAVPPAEAAIHPVETTRSCEPNDGRSLLGAVVYLMCDDLGAEIKQLSAKQVTCSPVETQRWVSQPPSACPAVVDWGYINRGIQRRLI